MLGVYFSRKETTMNYLVIMRPDEGTDYPVVFHGIRDFTHLLAAVDDQCYGVIASILELPGECSIVSAEDTAHLVSE